MGKDFTVAAYTSPTNIYVAMGDQYKGECTAYAWGRAYEVLGKSHKLPNKAAGKWYDAEHGYTKSQTPRAKAIGCFGSHVTYIESYDSKTDKLTFSEANWYTSTDKRFSNGKWEADPDGTDGVVKSTTGADFKKRTGGGSFQGFIYLP